MKTLWITLGILAGIVVIIGIGFTVYALSLARDLFSDFHGAFMKFVDRYY